MERERKGVTGIYWVEVRKAAEHPTVHKSAPLVPPSTTNNHVARNLSSLEILLFVIYSKEPSDQCMICFIISALSAR